ncbi:MAG: Calcium-transporting ATPase [Promethearchaeota archaeon]|nr:MAG: Calcium-transporting ATPase [Candidatus Lokiarchaeota archaeon]
MSKKSVSILEKESFYDKSVEKSLEILESSERGVSKEEALKRLQIFGRNELTAQKKDSKLKLFFKQFNDFLIIILIIAALISAIVGEYIESIIIWAILLANAFLGFIQESRAEEALNALKELGALKAKVVRAGEKKEVSSLEIVPGDLVLVEKGNKIPADGRVIKDINLYVDESTLTGESVPVHKTSEKIIVEKGQSIPINDQTNIVFSSTIVTNGRAKILITDTGMSTEVGKIANLIQTQIDTDTPLNRKLKKFGRQLGIIILIICVVIFILNILRDESLLLSFIETISLAVAAIPEGLPVVVTTTLAIGVTRMANRNAIIRKLPAIETLGATTTICTDKTGTLTRNEMTIKRIYTDFILYEVSGEGYEPKGVIKQNNTIIEPERKSTIYELALAGVLANNAELVQNKKGQFTIQGDPTEGAFIVLGEKLKLHAEQLNKRYERIQEYFFDSERKRMSVIVKEQQTNDDLLYMKGAPEIVLNLCNRILVDGTIRPLSEEDRSNIIKINNEMAEKALRVLGAAFDKCTQQDFQCKPELIEEDLIFIGLVGMIDPPRSEVKEAIARAREASVEVIMITGDQATTAKAIGSELNIVSKEDGTIITGQIIDKLSDDQLLGCKLFARVAPEHKLRIVNMLQEKGEIVAMTGDGVNDAPALKKADTGIAMGITGTDVSQEASDMILADDNFATIVNAIEEGRGIYDNMKKFILFLISCNIAEIMLIFIGIVLGLPLPLIAIQILWINLMTDGLPALALSVDPYEEDIMERRPRDPNENIITKRFAISILSRAIIITIICLSLYIIALQIYVPNWRQLDKYASELYLPRSFVFSTLIICELLNVFNCRSERQTIFQKNFFNNLWLLGAVFLSFILNLVLIYIPFLADIFQIAPLAWNEWFIIVLLAFITVIAEELIKLYYRKRKYAKK